MTNKIKQYIQFLTPYKGIIYFLILLFFFHFSWKIAIDGDMSSKYIYIFHKNVTPDWFHSACQWLTQAVYWFVCLFPGSENFRISDTSLFFINGGIRIDIIWGCLGIKQMFIFAGIMLFYRGPFLKKLWYIPMGCLILTIYNIIRIAGICWLTNGHPDRFDSLHDGIFRYIYYGIVFLLWVVWEEFFVNKRRKVKEEIAT